MHAIHRPMRKSTLLSNGREGTCSKLNLLFSALWLIPFTLQCEGRSLGWLPRHHRVLPLPWAVPGPSHRARTLGHVSPGCKQIWAEASGGCQVNLRAAAAAVPAFRGNRAVLSEIRRAGVLSQSPPFQGFCWGSGSLLKAQSVLIYTRL